LRGNGSTTGVLPQVKKARYPIIRRGKNGRGVERGRSTQGREAGPNLSKRRSTRKSTNITVRDLTRKRRFLPKRKLKR